MSTITLSTSLPIGNQSIGQRRFDIMEASQQTGAQAVRLLGPPRWTMSLSSPQKMTLTNAGLWESMLIQLRGSVNVLAAWDVNRPAPLGTARGSPSTTGTTVAGATSMTVTGFSASGTLKQGDWLMIGSGAGTSHLCKVTADVTLNGSGAGTVSFEPPTRQQFNAATAITWDKALGYYRMLGNGVSWNAVPGWLAAEGHSLDLMETWTA